MSLQQTSSWTIVGFLLYLTCRLSWVHACIGWHAAARDNKTGAPVADPEKFPNGIKDLSDKIHALGLKVWSCCVSLANSY
jgi:hypothetical protein